MRNIVRNRVVAGSFAVVVSLMRPMIARHWIDRQEAWKRMSANVPRKKLTIEFEFTVSHDGPASMSEKLNQHWDRFAQQAQWETE
ncbi:hypothetical protein AB0G00_32985 [Nocardia salmonicida]|uniref:hypothetical protein n=1 Tax=Nocardia salmonicida TaxID=53431 RepID=UPI0033DBD826